jgi:hypothetical protein
VDSRGLRLPEPTLEPNDPAALGWRARDARPADRGSLVKVFNEAFHRHDEVSLLDWRYDRNPHGSAWTVVAADGADAPVGSYSFVPRRYVVNGAETLVMQASDAMVFPNWQRKGIFRGLDSILCERAAKAGISFGFAFCGRRSQKGFLDNGWLAIAKYRQWTRVLRVGAAAFEARRTDGRLRRALVPLEALRARSKDRALRAALEGFEDSPVERFDGAIARLPNPNYRIVGIRDAPYLDWRMLETPRRTHRPFLLRRRGEIVGFYDVECSPAGRGYLLDARGADLACERAALAGAIERLRAVGAGTVQTTVLESSFLDAHVRDLGFEAPAERDILPFIVRVFRSDAASEAALDPKSWYVLDADRDAEGMV